MNKSDIIISEGISKGQKWYKIDIQKIKNKLSGKKFNKIIKTLEWYPLGAYYRIYEKNFNDWFDKLNELITEQQEAPTDSPIEMSEDIKDDRIEKRYKLLMKKDKNGNIKQELNIEEVKKYFTNKDEYNKALKLATKQTNNVYRLNKSDINDFKQLIKAHQIKSNQQKERYKEEGRKEVEEQKDKEIKKLQEQHNEEIQEERKDKSKKVAEAINKYKPVASSGAIDAVEEPKSITTTNNSPSIKDFIKNAYLNGDYKLGRDELHKRYTSGKYKQILKDVNIENVINDVMLYSELETTKKKNKLAQLAQIGAFSPEAVANMDPNTQEEINNAIIAKSRIDNANKRLKYKLPINKPKARAAMINQHINPMVFRGAFSTGNY